MVLNASKIGDLMKSQHFKVLVSLNTVSENMKCYSLLFRRWHPFIHYETFAWVVYGTFTILAVVDRFVWNVWPRETYSIGAGSAGSDFVDGLKAGPWAVQLYDAVARISGRFSIIALNLLVFTMSHTAYSWLAESWLARNVFDMHNYIEANRRLHKYNGILIAVMTLLHVWSIVFPCIFHGWHAQVVLGHFEWILSERGPEGFKEISTDSKTMSLQGDDVFRIVEMTILLGILLPLSIRWLSTRWHLGVQLHSLINILYFIDIVRRHTHPHSWIMNTPFFVLWIVDLTAGVYWRRERPEVFKRQLCDDYMLLIWNQARRSRTVGPKYYLRLEESSLMERAHVFTGFENRTNLDLIDGKPWSVCLVLRVYHSKRRPRLGKKDGCSHTQRVAELTNLDLWTWGPFVGEMSEKIRGSLESGNRNVTLVAGGSAVGYIFDAIQLSESLHGRITLTCLYTVRSVEMFDWVWRVFAHLLRNRTTKNVSVVVALTSGGDGSTQNLITEVEKGRLELIDLSDSTFGNDLTNRSRMCLQFGRLNFSEQIPDRNLVFFQGSWGLQKAVKRGCKDRKCILTAGPAYDKDLQRKQPLLHALKEKYSTRCGVVV